MYIHTFSFQRCSLGGVQELGLVNFHPQNSKLMTYYTCTYIHIRTCLYIPLVFPSFHLPLLLFPLSGLRCRSPPGGSSVARHWTWSSVRRWGGCTCGRGSAACLSESLVGRKTPRARRFSGGHLKSNTANTCERIIIYMHVRKFSYICMYMYVAKCDLCCI